MTANQGDANELVERALSHCEMAFTKGVHSFHAGGQPSDVEIGDGVIDGVKEWLRQSFKNRLDHEDGPERWEQEGYRVRRTGFYAGALAAFHAYAGNAGRLEAHQADVAMAHVSEHCKDPNNPQIRWWYCP